MTIKKDAFRTARTRIVTLPAADNPDAWPRADSQRCCIFEALNIVGSAKYGSEWSGSELKAFFWNDQPKDIEDQRLAELLIPKPVSKAPPPISIANYNRQYDHPVEVQLQGPQNDQPSIASFAKMLVAKQREAVDAEQKLWEDNYAAATRLRKATDWLAQECSDGHITGYCRLQVGGSLGPMEAHEWNVDYPLAKFVANGGFEKYFALEKPVVLPVFIFFDRAPLIAATQIFAHAPTTVSETDLAKLSPYLRFAISLALHKGYVSEQDCSTLGERQTAVHKEWKNALPDVPVSDPQVEMIAKMMAWPNAKAIEKGLKAKNRGR